MAGSSCGHAAPVARLLQRRRAMMMIEEDEAPAPTTVRERCAGLDVHRSTIVACATSPLGGGRLRKIWNEFATTAAGLSQLAAWLREQGVTHVGMEATGVYWMPVYA